MEHIKRIIPSLSMLTAALLLTGCTYIQQKNRQRVCENEVERISKWDDAYCMVLKKYEDMQNRGAETLQIRIKGHVREINFLSPYHVRQLWDRLEVGDSLVKEKDSVTFEVYRGGRKSFEVTLECPEMPNER